MTDDRKPDRCVRHDCRRALAESRAEVAKLRKDSMDSSMDYIALRERCDRAESEANDYGDQRDAAIARAERLAELLREALPFVNDVAHDDETWQRIDAALNLEPNP